tara:strand:+ start:37 stop:648 length:612 start_codon:yes stop_codon:yes gene_type:complete
MKKNNYKPTPPKKIRHCGVSMKGGIKIKIFFISIFSSILFSQNSSEIPENFNKEKDSLIYEEVVKVDGLSKDLLYEKIERYIVYDYKSSNDVVQLNNKEKGNIIVKGTGSITTGRMVKIEVFVPHTLDIKVKDGRYKYTLISNTLFTISGGKNIFSIDDLLHNRKYGKLGKIWVNDSDTFLKSLIVEMKDYIENDTTTEEEDW